MKLQCNDPQSAIQLMPSRFCGATTLGFAWRGRTQALDDPEEIDRNQTYQPDDFAVACHREGKEDSRRSSFGCTIRWSSVKMGKEEERCHYILARCESTACSQSAARGVKIRRVTFKALPL